jgi:hypothetical protein
LSLSHPPASEVCDEADCLCRRHGPNQDTGAASATASPATSRKRKGDGGGKGTPTKKRATPKKTQQQQADTCSDSGDLPQDMEEFST